MKKTITTHAEDSPVCDKCKRKGQGWFEQFKTCQETGKAPIWVQEEIEVAGLGELKVSGLSSGERLR